MDAIWDLTIKHLETLGNPVHMILASRLYGAERELLIPALKIFCRREKEITVEEAQALESQDVLLIIRLKGVVRVAMTQRPGGKTSEEVFLTCFNRLQRMESIYIPDLTNDNLEDILKQARGPIYGI